MRTPLLNDLYRMLVWQSNDTEPESVGRWEQVRPQKSGNSPSPRRGAAAVAVTRNELLLYGGCDHNALSMNDLWLYNADRNVWIDMSQCVDGQHPPPSSSYHHMLLTPNPQHEQAREIYQGKIKAPLFKSWFKSWFKFPFFIFFKNFYKPFPMVF